MSALFTLDLNIALCTSKWLELLIVGHFWILLWMGLNLKGNKTGRKNFLASHVVIVVMVSHVVVVVKLVIAVWRKVSIIVVFRVLLAAQVSLRVGSFICRITISNLLHFFIFLSAYSKFSLSSLPTKKWSSGTFLLRPSIISLSSLSSIIANELKLLMEMT